MFARMIEELQTGHKPEAGPLRQRLQAALVKKMAMLRLAREFQHNDPKINPNSEHMLWAATLLGDDESQEVMVNILLTEAHAHKQAKRGSSSSSKTPPDAQQIIAASLGRLMELCSSQQLRDCLQTTIKKSAVFNDLQIIKN